MKIEQKVVSLETAKKLKKIGFPQDTERVYLLHRSKEYSLENTLWFESEDGEWGCRCSIKDLCPIAAPDAQEIGELLIKNENLVTMFFPNGRCQIALPEWPSSYFERENEAEARAAIWIWLQSRPILEPR